MNHVPNRDAENVCLAPGPDGRQGGSYKLEQESHIKFYGEEDGILDVRYSMTILFWFFYTGQAKNTSIVRYLNKKRSLGVFVSEHTDLQARIVKRDLAEVYTLKAPFSAGSWTFVAITFNHTSGEAKLWINAVVANETTIKGKIELSTQHNLKIGGSKFKGRITQLRIYNYPLTKEKIREINKTLTVPG